MPKGEKLSKKQKGFIRDYIKTGNGTQSALKNYDTKNVTAAGAIAVENLRKPLIINAIKSIADRIPDELLEKVHMDGLNATNNEIPDYSVRHKYLDSAYKLKGSYAPEKKLNLNITHIENREKMEKLGQELADKLLKEEIENNS